MKAGHSNHQSAAEIFRLPPAAQEYEPPLVSMLPLIERAFFMGGKKYESLSRFLEPDVNFLPSGRVALYHALLLAGVDNNTEVLLPAYHCGSMIEPVLHLRATPVFFSLNEDLTFDLQEIKQIVSKKSKALVIPHFFGFQQSLHGLRRLADELGMRLIEDCAHSFYKSMNDDCPIGKIGDFAIASTIKFFPGTKGGALAINAKGRTLPPLKAPGLVENVKDLKRTVDRLLHYKQLNRIPDQDVKRSEPKCGVTTYETHSIGRDHYLWFDEDEIEWLNSHMNLFFIRHSNHEVIRNKRRANYQLYSDLFGAMQGVKCLHSKLGDNVPYVFPLIMEHPENHFYSLKKARLPIWRWEELVKSDCKVSNGYRHTLLQLPCHQSVKFEHIRWIAHSFDTIINHQQ